MPPTRRHGTCARRAGADGACVRDGLRHPAGQWLPADALCPARRWLRTAAAESELLGYGRDPLAPIKDAVTADGEVVVPIDVEAFGFWLKAAFGQPVTTGTTPKTHTFQSGNWTLPSMAIETAMPEVPRFAMYSGCVLDQLSWQMQRSGLLTATARLVAQGETIAATTAAGTPTALGLQRFGHFNGTVKRNGTALGNVVSAEITYSNNLDRIETIRGDGRIEGPTRPWPR
jgi:hypothetical protein